MIDPERLLGLAGVLFIDFLLYRHLVRPILIEYNSIRRLRKTGVITQGTIVGFKQKLDVDDKEQYAPVVSFIAEDGIEYKVESDDFRGVKPRIGSAIEVCYAVGNPTNAVPDSLSFMRFKFFLIIMVSLIAMAVTAGMVGKILGYIK